MEAAVKARDRMPAAGWNWKNVVFAAGNSFLGGAALVSQKRRNVFWGGEMHGWNGKCRTGQFRDFSTVCPENLHERVVEVEGMKRGAAA